MLTKIVWFIGLTFVVIHTLNIIINTKDIFTKGKEAERLSNAISILLSILILIYISFTVRLIY